MRSSDFGWTPLLFAASAGVVQIVKILLRAKATLDAACAEGNSALALATRGGHLEAMQLLISSEADLEARNRHGWTPLIWCAIDGKVEAARALLEASADFHAVDGQRRNACMWAARHGHQDVLNLLLERNLDLRVQDEDGLTAMDHAAEHLALKASIVLAEELNRRLLDAAVRNDSGAVAEAIEEGACVDTQDEQGWTPLMWAALHDSMELVSVLVQHGADPMLLGEEAELAEHVAAQHLAASSALATVVEGTRRLLTSSVEGDWYGLEEALGMHPFINIKDKDKRTSLMWAAANGGAEAVQMLLDASPPAPMEERDAWGWTALLFGVQSRSPETVTTLFNNKADVAVANFAGDGVLQLAVKIGDPVMLQVLLGMDVSIETLDYSFYTPLHLASVIGAAEITGTLIFLGASIEAADDRGRSPLALAAMAGQHEICEVFLPDEDDEYPPDEQRWQAAPEVPFEVSDSEAERTPSDSEASDEGSPKSKGGKGKGKKGKKGKGKGKEKGGDEPGSPESPGSPTSPSPRSPSSPTSRRAKGEPAASSPAASSPAASSHLAELGEDAEAAPEVAEPAPLKPSEELLRWAAKRRMRLMRDPPLVPMPEALLKATDEDGCPVLQLACRGRAAKRPIVRFLLERNADLNAQDATGRTALMEAALSGNREVVEELLSEQPDLAMVDQAEQTATQLAASPEVRRMLEREEALRMAGSAPGSAAPSRSASKTSKSRSASKSSQAEAPPPAVFRVRIEQLPTKVTRDILVDEIRSLLRYLRTGRPVHLEVAMDVITERPRGHAYVDFMNQEGRDLALRGNGEEVLGCSIRTFCDLPSAMVR